MWSCGQVMRSCCSSCVQCRTRMMHQTPSEVTLMLPWIWGQFKNDLVLTWCRTALSLHPDAPASILVATWDWSCFILPRPFSGLSATMTVLHHQQFPKQAKSSNDQLNWISSSFVPVEKCHLFEHITSASFTLLPCFAFESRSDPRHNELQLCLEVSSYAGFTSGLCGRCRLGSVTPGNIIPRQWCFLEPHQRCLMSRELTHGSAPCLLLGIAIAIEYLQGSFLRVFAIRLNGSIILVLLWFQT